MDAVIPVFGRPSRKIAAECGLAGLAIRRRVAYYGAADRRGPTICAQIGAVRVAAGPRELEEKA